jgi:hypothetical protein
MPIVYTTHILDRNRASVLCAMSRFEPDATTFRFLEETARRFRLEADDMVIEREVACRGCGCTEENACAGGCSWVEPDLCSRCASTQREQRSAGARATRSVVAEARTDPGGRR